MGLNALLVYGDSALSGITGLLSGLSSEGLAGVDGEVNLTLLFSRRF